MNRTNTIYQLMTQLGERGATAVEYSLIVALIASVIIAVVTALGGDVDWLFTQVDFRD